jgi:hypothetical protein
VGPQNVSLVRVREKDEGMVDKWGVPTEKTSAAFCSYFNTLSTGKKMSLQVKLTK